MQLTKKVAYLKHSWLGFLPHDSYADFHAAIHITQQGLAADWCAIQHHTIWVCIVDRDAGRDPRTLTISAAPHLQDEVRELEQSVAVQGDPTNPECKHWLKTMDARV
jgi:hypothetical protein